MEKRLAKVRDAEPVKFMKEESSLEREFSRNRPSEVGGESDPAEPVEELVERLLSESTSGG